MEKLLTHVFFRLIEVDSDLANTLEEGQELVFRGDEDDNAVLCTNNKTYEIKEAETSNSILILDNLTFPDSKDAGSGEERYLTERQVLGVFHTYLELKVCKPTSKKLFNLLSESPMNARLRGRPKPVSQALTSSIPSRSATEAEKCAIIQPATIA